jgi:hypothetical protein
MRAKLTRSGSIALIALHPLHATAAAPLWRALSDEGALWLLTPPPREGGRWPAARLTGSSPWPESRRRGRGRCPVAGCEGDDAPTSGG